VGARTGGRTVNGKARKALWGSQGDAVGKLGGRCGEARVGSGGGSIGREGSLSARKGPASSAAETSEAGE
jgi:hypothetical protein